MRGSNVRHSYEKVSKIHFLALLGAFISLITYSGIARSTTDEPVLLSISGNIADSENSQIALNLTALTKLASTTVTTSAPWTDGPTEFVGVRINELLEHVGAKSNQFEALAINDYKFTLKDIDFDRYPIIIAYKKNGELMEVRDLGPLMIVFPFDDYPELLTERNKAASVWQLIEMIVL